MHLRGKFLFVSFCLAFWAGIARSQAATEGSAAAALDGAAATQAINAADFSARGDVLSPLTERFNTSLYALVGIERRGEKLSGKSREEFKSAIGDVKSKGHELGKALKAAGKSTEAAWPAARAELAAKYGVYAEAVGKAEALVKAIPAQ